MRAQIQLKYVNEFTDRHGRRRRYFRAPGRPGIVLPADLPLHSPEFLDLYNAELAKVETPHAIGAARSLPGTIRAVVAGYKASPHFAGLAKATREMRRRELDRFCQEHGGKPIARLEPQHVVKIMERRTPAAAHNLLKALRGLMQYALSTGAIKTDPTAPVKRPGLPDSEGHHDWSDTEIAQYRAAHPLGSMARLAMELGYCTIQRRFDVWRMGRQHLQERPEGQAICIRQQKTGMEVEIPLLPELAEALAVTPTGDLQWLVTERGLPFASEAAFGNKVRDWCDAAGLPQCSLHGLRKAGARRLIEHGATAAQVAAWGGWESLKEVQRYVDKYNRRQAAWQGAKLLANAAGTKNLQTSPKKLTNLGSK